MYYFAGMKGNRYCVMDTADGVTDVVDAGYIEKVYNMGFYIFGLSPYNLDKPSKAYIKLNDVISRKLPVKDYIRVVDIGITTFETDGYEEYDKHSKVYKSLYFIMVGNTESDMRHADYLLSSCNLRLIDEPFTKKDKHGFRRTTGHPENNLLAYLKDICRKCSVSMNMADSKDADRITQEFHPVWHNIDLDIREALLDRCM